MSGPVLVLNCGSSSVKYRLVQPASGESLADGVIERVDDYPKALQQVFDAVATRFVQVFLGDRVQDVTTAHATSNGVPFRARGVVVTDPGWSVLEPEAPKKRKGKAKGKDGADADDDGDDEAQELPELREGEAGPHQPELHEVKS